MNDTKLNLSALKKDSPTLNIENEVTDLILEPEEIGISDDIIETNSSNIKENTISVQNDAMGNSENQTVRDEVILDLWLEEFKKDLEWENNSLELSQDEKPVAVWREDKVNPIIETKTDIEEGNLGLFQENGETAINLKQDEVVPVIETEQDTWEDKEISGKKKKTMLSLSSIKSIPKTEAEKQEEAKKALIEKTEAEKPADQKWEEIKNWAEPKKEWEENIVSTEDIEIWEALELVPEDKKIVEEATKNIQKDLNTVDNNIEDDTVQITLDKSLFDNYIPNYKGKKESKADRKEKKKEQKNEKGTNNLKKRKRIRGPINKKKRNILIVAMFLCILGSWGFVLYPHIHDSSDIKSDVIQVTQNEVKEKVNLVLESESEEDIADEEDESQSDEVAEAEVQSEESTEIKKVEKDDKTKVKNYLLDNYYN